MSYKLSITAPQDRRKLASATLYNDKGEKVHGPFDCLALADSTKARNEGNPSRNPLLPFGDTPTGVYKGNIIAPIGVEHSYGPGEAINLQPVSGDCKLCGDTRTGLLVHGGDLNTTQTYMALWRGLRPTYGCVRFKNEDLKTVTDALKGQTFDVELSEQA